MMKRFLWVVLLLLPACTATLVRDAGTSRLERSDVERLVQAFLYWSDLGLYGRDEWERKEWKTDGFLTGDPLADGGELEKLLSPELRVVVRADDGLAVQSRAEFVNRIQRSRFMWKIREGLLDGPHYSIESHRAIVRMRTFWLRQEPGEVPSACDSVLTVALDGASPVITVIERSYRKATEEEAKRIPQLPGFAHPPGAGDVHVASSLEEWKRSMEAVPSRPATRAQILAWIDELEDTDEKPSTRGLAAFHLGMAGSQAREASPALIVALKDRERSVRRSAAEALGRIGDASAIPALTEALNDDSSDVRFQAKWALERIQASRYR